MWLIEQNFLSNFTDLFQFYFQSENSIVIVTEAESKYILYYADNILYLNEKYYSINSFGDNNKQWEDLKTRIIQKISEQDHEYALILAEKYKDFYSMVQICFKNNNPNRLKENMYRVKNFTRFALRQYLILEIKNNKNDHTFSFFENFSDFKQELEELSDKYPKISFLYRLFLNNYDNLNFTRVFYESANNNIENKMTYQKISKLMNCISEKSQKLISNQMEEDYLTNDAEKNYLESDFYLMLNHIKLKFNIKKLIFNFTDIIDELLKKSDQEYFDGGIFSLKKVISRKYIMLLQLFVLAKDLQSSTSSESLEIHNEIINASYIVNKLLILEIGSSCFSR